MTVYARIDNLSEGGLFLRTSTPLERGAKAILRFGAADSVEVEAHAEVVWARGEGDLGPPGMGMQFKGIPPDKLELIRRVILGEQKSKKPGDSSADTR